MSDDGKRCPGGYLVRGNQLCGRAGNQCVGRCAFAYRDPRWELKK